ncbi:MAG: hypothetical protein J6V49_02125, partial [Bacteroidales bacterium]|nr:hypothetical protein [Bacteroidales bacterium]
MDEMWRSRGEDDGSLLLQMTEDAAEAGVTVRQYHTTHCFIFFVEALSEWMKCGGLKIWGEGSVQVVHDRAPISQRASQFAIITKLT